MCGRTSLFVPVDVLEDYFDAEVDYELQPRYNVSPGDDLDVIPNDDPEQFDRHRWGLRPHWVDEPDDWGHPINARAETVGEKPSFRTAFEKRRCLVAADGFYEWQGQRGSKQPYRVERSDDEQFAFAGLRERWGEDGDELETVTIITTEPNDVLEPIHDRMPVMLERDEHETWLESDDEEELQSLLDPFPEELTEAYPISKTVNNPDNDSPEVVEPLDIGDQSGLGEFSA